MIFADVPNPVSVITDALGGAAGWAFDKVAEGIAAWVLDAVGFFVEGAIGFLRTSSRPDVGAAWFSGASSPYATTRSIAAVLLVAFTLMGIVQGLLAGDAPGMIRRMAGRLPLSVGGMVVTTVLVARLLDLTDVLSSAVLSNGDEQALHFLAGFGAAATSMSQGFAAVVLGLVAVIAALLLWIELIVRGALVYLLVALTPLVFAASVWPAARGALRKLIELLIATIVSKLVICVAVSVGVAALSGAGATGEGDGIMTGGAESTGVLLAGTVLLGLAAFAPFVVLRLVPVAEAALVAQGISRSPGRVAQQGMSTAYSASMLTRVAGGGAHPAVAAGAAASAIGGGAVRNVADSASSIAGAES